MSSGFRRSGSSVLRYLSDVMCTVKDVPFSSAKGLILSASTPALKICARVHVNTDVKSERAIVQILEECCVFDDRIRWTDLYTHISA